MTFLERMRDGVKRGLEIKKWSKRFEVIEAYGVSMASLCRDNKPKLDQSQICHQMAGRRGAEWDHINQVNAMLDAAYKELGIPLSVKPKKKKK